MGIILNALQRRELRKLIEKQQKELEEQEWYNRTLTFQEELKRTKQDALLSWD